MPASKYPKIMVMTPYLVAIAILQEELNVDKSILSQFLTRHPEMPTFTYASLVVVNRKAFMKAWEARKNQDQQKKKNNKQKATSQRGSLYYFNQYVCHQNKRTAQPSTRLCSPFL